MLRTGFGSLLVALLTLPAAAADPYSLKVVDKSTPPQECTDAVKKLLTSSSIQFCNDKGEALAELWLRKEVPAKATEAQIKNGLTYQEVPLTTLLGVLRLNKEFTDYKKQKIKAGTYTLRILNQPMDGDHMGTAPNGEFVLLVPAAKDNGEAAMEPEALHKASTRASHTGHPAVFLLFPLTPREIPNAPKLVKQMGDHWVVQVKLDVVVNGKKAVLGLALTLIGVSTSA